jgi:hypothetical protein
MRLRSIVICGLPRSLVISTLSQNRKKKKKKGTEQNVFVVISSAAFFWNIPHSKKNRARDDNKKMCIGLLIKYPLFLPDFNKT